VGAGRRPGRLPVAGQPAVEWREILDVHTTRTVEGWRASQWCCAFKTRPNWILRRNGDRDWPLSHEAQHGPGRASDLAVTPAGVALGVLDAWMWARKPKDQPDVKESIRWVEGYEIVADLAETSRIPAWCTWIGKAICGADRCRRPARHAGRLADPVEAQPQDHHGREVVEDSPERSAGEVELPAGGAGSPGPGGAADALSHGECVRHITANPP
jgi:hypothetical protein